MRNVFRENTKHKVRYRTLAATAFAATLVLTLAMSFSEQQAFARPDPGFAVGDHVMKINLKGVPNTTNRACDQSSSNNIYTPFGTDDGTAIPAGHQHIRWHHATSNVVVDHCTEALDGDYAVVDLQDGTYVYTIRMLGPPTGHIRFCSQIESLHNGETHCILDTVVVREKGAPKFTIPSTIFDDALEDQIWSLVANDKFRNAQIDIWEAAPLT